MWTWLWEAHQITHLWIRRLKTSTAPLANNSTWPNRQPTDQTFRYKSLANKTCKRRGTSTCRHPATKTTSFPRRLVRTTGLLLICRRRSLTAWGTMELLANSQVRSTLLQAKCLPSSTNKFKCSVNIHKSGQLRATFSIQSSLVVELFLLTVSYRALKLNTQTPCRSLLNYKLIKANKGHIQELMNLPVTANSHSIQAVRIYPTKPFRLPATEFPTKGVLTRRSTWELRWNIWTWMWVVGLKSHRIWQRYSP